jgi:hypothetical protein
MAMGETGLFVSPVRSPDGSEGRPMSTINGRLPWAFTPLMAMAVLALGANPARAYFDLLGWGLGFNQVSPTTDFLNQRALIQGSVGMQQRPSHNPMAGNPNAYFNQIRDNGFVPRFDVRRRRAPSYRPAPTASPGQAEQVQPQPAPAATAPRPVSPLVSFFDASLRLVWPSDAPIGGDLREKRDVSDQASRAVLEETRRQSVASISSVTEARQKLLNYGQPALREIRAMATPRVAEGFHSFLLSLYDSLADAASPR